MTEAAGIRGTTPTASTFAQGALRDSKVLIPLSRGNFAKIDGDDYEFVAMLKWHWRPSVTRVGKGYAVAKAPPGYGRRSVFMHRLILGADRNQEVDHINRDSLDNRKSNLRFATRSQNIANSLARPNANGFRGVCIDRRSKSKQFFASICVNYRRLKGPYRWTQAEAALDYDKMARQSFGEFATLNFPGGA